MDERKGIPSFIVPANESDLSQHLKSYIFPDPEKKDFKFPRDDYQTSAMQEFHSESKKIEEF